MKIPPDFLIKLGVSEDDLDDLAARKEALFLMGFISILDKDRSDAVKNSKHPHITAQVWAPMIDPLEEKLRSVMEKIKW